jgi:hypothetical protein
VGTSEISWGDLPAGSGMPQSAYSFVGRGTPFDTSVDQMFNLGTFTHKNNPIWTNGEMLNGARLALTFTIEGANDVFRSVFDFQHLETPNESNPCANGEGQGVGVNVNGCADRVTLALNEDESESFTVGHMEYVLDISGFLYNDSLMKRFWTKEKAENVADLQASYKLISDNTPPKPVTPPTTPSEVPLPASGLLLLGGLGAIYAKRRKS